MHARIIGISGSPIPNSNTDRIIQTVLEASGLPFEFVKLSKIMVRPCLGCLKCTSDNRCKVPDDFPRLAEKMRAADALVIGGHTPYRTVDAFTKAFLERLFSLRHRLGLNRGKLAVIITTGIGRGRRGIDEANAIINEALEAEGMQVVGRLKVLGNPPCLICGYGATCPMSSLPVVFGEGARPGPEALTCVEDQTEVWRQARECGRTIARMLGENQQI